MGGTKLHCSRFRVYLNQGLDRNRQPSKFYQESQLNSRGNRSQGIFDHINECYKHKQSLALNTLRENYHPSANIKKAGVV